MFALSYAELLIIGLVALLIVVAIVVRNFGSKD